jgi:hypothetical protein
VRTNRTNNAAEPRHRKPGPARETGTSVPGQRVREDVEIEDEDAAPWQRTASKR